MSAQPPAGYQALGPAVTVDAGQTTAAATGFDLTVGTRYKIEVSGTITDANPMGMGYDYDAMYCYGDFGFDPSVGPQCQPPNLGANVYVGIGSGPLEHVDAHQLPSGDTTSQPAYDPPYDPSHTYALDYWPQASGELMAGGYFAYSGCKNPPPGNSPCQDTIFGTFTIQVFAPSSGGGGTGGGGTGGGGTGGGGGGGATGGSSTCLHLSNNTSCVAVLLGSLTQAGQALTVNAPPTGDPGFVQIMQFGNAVQETTSIGGLSAQDIAVLEGAKTGCYIKFTGQLALALGVLTQAHKGALQQAKTAKEKKELEDEYARLDIPLVEIGLKAELDRCVAFVEAVEILGAAGKLAPDTGHAASSSCQMSAVSLSVGGSAARPRLNSFAIVPKSEQSLHATCASGSGTVAVSVATSPRPLSSVLGPTIGLAIVRGASDPPGGTLSFSYTTQGGTSAPPNITGSWVNKAAPNGGPPWQLATSNNLKTLDISWQGGTGHPNLRGTFRGSLATVNGSYVYQGKFSATENSTHVSGTMSVTIDTANQIEIDLNPTGGQPQQYTFVRTS